MIKKTLYFGNPAYLSLKNQQLTLRLPEVDKATNLSVGFKKEVERTFPIEDLGVVVLDHKQITITQSLIGALLENNCALISCDAHSLPAGLMLPLCGNTTQSERFQDQISASQPLKKQLWQQTVKAKIANQATLLHRLRKAETGNMRAWVNDVKSGDTMNLEGRAAAYYWKKLFPQIPFFTRDREGIPPNNLLNYGYAILRAVVARALVVSGMLPTLGIHHHNRYNAYCLADDIMEAYRPYVDEQVCQIIDETSDVSVLTKEIKARLLTIPALDVEIDGKRSALMVAVSGTTASLYRCFAGISRNIMYPIMR